MNKIVLISFPRCGGNFLIQKMCYETGLRIEYRHNFKEIKEEIILNIVRNPIDSFVSTISMDKELNIYQYEMSDADFVTHKMIPYYLAMYHYLFNSDKKVIFINYEDLNKDQTFIKLYNLLNIALKVGQDNNFNFIEDIKNYQITSKNNDNYNSINNMLSQIDLSECYKLYDQALKKCIKL